MKLLMMTMMLMMLMTLIFCGAFQVSEKLKLGAKTAIDIDKLRDGYRPAAKLGAVLFFVLSEMSVVNSMYQYSLNSYLEVFGLSLRKSLPDTILPKRLKNIMDTLTVNVYNYACTGMMTSRARTSFCLSDVTSVKKGRNEGMLEWMNEFINSPIGPKPLRGVLRVTSGHETFPARFGRLVNVRTIHDRNMKYST